jgi:hypothetical protein
MHTMNRFSSAFIATVLLSAGVANAQPARNQNEARQDRQEVRQDKQALRDDRRDVADLEDVLARFDRAWNRQNEREMTAVENRLRELMRQELAESRAEFDAAQAEARRSGRELRSEQREANRGGWGRPETYDRRDVRDDRRDRRDDVKDTRVEVATLQTRAAIARELHWVMGSRNPVDLQRERNLITQLIQVARAEVQQTKQELREDRQERREDRQERREDRRR